MPLRPLYNTFEEEQLQKKLNIFAGLYSVVEVIGKPICRPKKGQNNNLEKVLRICRLLEKILDELLFLFFIMINFNRIICSKMVSFGF